MGNLIEKGENTPSLVSFSPWFAGVDESAAQGGVFRGFWLSWGGLCVTAGISRAAAPATCPLSVTLESSVATTFHHHAKKLKVPCDHWQVDVQVQPCVQPYLVLTIWYPLTKEVGITHECDVRS